MLSMQRDACKNRRTSCLNKFIVKCNISNLVPKHMAWAPSARAATYPRASTIPPAAITGMSLSPTRSTTRGTSAIKDS